MIDIQKTKYLFFGLALFALPFNSLPIHFKKLGHLSHEGAFYPLLILVLLFSFQIIYNIIKDQEISITHSVLVRLVIVFFIYILFVFIYNYNEIINHEHMNIFGLTRFYVSTRVLLFSFLVMFAIASTVTSRTKFESTIQIINIVVALFLLFAIFQFLAYEFKGVFLDLYRGIGQYIYPEGLLEWALNRRHALHSVTQEPSFLSMYLSVMAPFVIMQSIEKKKYILLTLLTIVIILSKSRTGYVIYTFELFLFFYFYHYHVIKWKYLLSISLFFLLFAFILYLTPLSTIYLSLFELENSSNAARYGAAYSTFLVWWNSNILLGVGIGQTGFSSLQYLPDWGHLTGDIVDTINEKRWPPIHNMLIRLLAETGLIGFTLFLSIYTYLLVQSYKIVHYKYTKKHENDPIGYAVLISLVASFLILFNKELFYNFNIWIAWGLALAYITISKKELKNAKIV